MVNKKTYEAVSGALSMPPQLSQMVSDYVRCWEVGEQVVAIDTNRHYRLATIVEEVDSQYKLSDKRKQWFVDVATRQVSDDGRAFTPLCDCPILDIHNIPETLQSAKTREKQTGRYKWKKRDLLLAATPSGYVEPARIQSAGHKCLEIESLESGNRYWVDSADRYSMDADTGVITNLQEDQQWWTSQRILFGYDDLPNGCYTNRPPPIPFFINLTENKNYEPDDL